jgi:3-oxoacyl-[acyl-carrier protein] reductase
MSGICEGRVAIVTGAGRGIGKGHAIELARQGAKVVVNDIGGAVDGSGSDVGPAQEVVNEIIATGGEAVANTDSVADWEGAQRMINQAVETFGRLDILVNNAGINSDKTFVKMDHASWRKVLSINLDGVFNCTKVFVDQMLKQNYGRVVNVTSVIGQIGNFGQANYAASKAGVAAFTKSLAKELAGKGITVNAVAPGFIETEMVDSIPEKVRARLLDQIPLRRFGSAEEVARAVTYLVSADGDYITGAELSINGGLLM